jgi:hypothetical protein
MANPLNAPYCAGNGLGTDEVGRPTWQMTYIGGVGSGSITRLGHSETSPWIAASVSLPMANTTSRPRNAMLRFSSAGVHLATATAPGAYVNYRFNLGPGVTSGLHVFGTAHFHGPPFSLRWPGRERVEITLVPAMTTYIAVFDVTAVGSFGSPNSYDVYIDSLNIDGWWMGA